MTGNNDGAAAGSGSERAPPLRANTYPSWKPAMDVYLQRHGAQGVHRDASLTAEQWAEDCADVAAWSKDALANARATARNGGAQASAAAAASSSGSSEAPKLESGDGLSADAKAARALVTANVDRSHKAYGSIYSALPEDLRMQVQHISQGWAYGLWMWLERKFQSTEADNVGELLLRWVQLAQQEVESFDAYRARVMELAALLEHAKQKQTPEMFCLFLLDRLQPRYTAAVLALKNGTLLKDKSNVDWEAVTTLINAHERDVIRKQSEEAGVAAAEAKAMAARASSSAAAAPRRGFSPVQDRRDGDNSHVGGGNRDHGSGSRGPRDLRKVQCYNCDEFGHISRNCRKPQKGDRRGAAASGGRRDDQYEQAKSVTTSTSKNARANSECSYAIAVQRGVARIATRAVGIKPKESEKSKEVPPQSVHSAAGAGAQWQEVRPPVSNTAPVRENRRAGVPAPRLSTPATLSATSAAASPAASDDSEVVFGVGVNGHGSASANKSRRSASNSKPKPKPRSIRTQRKAKRKLVSAAALAAQAPAPAPTREFGIDSMASVNISGSKSLFRPGSLRSCEPFTVKVADNGVVNVTQVGSVEININVSAEQTVTFVIEKVFYHSRFGANLLSLDWLTDSGWAFHSTKEETFLLTPDKFKVKLRKENRVSILRCSSTKAGSSEQRVFQFGDLVWDSASDLVRLHERLGHMGVDRMLRIIKAGATDGIGKLNMSPAVVADARKRVLECRACTRGKGCRTAFGHRGVDKGSAKGETLHMDMYYVKYARADGVDYFEYGVTVSDPHTTFRWNSRQQSKDLIPASVIEIIRVAQTQFNCVVKRIVTDGGTEFINQTLKKFCSEHGIEIHYPPARTPQLNSVAERNVRSGKDAGRTLLMHAGLPAYFGPIAVQHANYVWNRTNIAAATGVTPYEAMLKRKPCIKHLSVFGCDAFHHVPKEKRDTFGAKMLPGIYLGHNHLRNCAIVFDLNTRKNVFTRDVECLDRRFTHAAALVAGGEKLQSILSGDGYTRDNSAAAAGCDGPSMEFEDDVDEDSGVFDVERIIGKREVNGQIQYHVRWVGYAKPTWEPASNVEQGSSELIEDFEEQQREDAAAADGEAAHLAPAALNLAAGGVEPAAAPVVDAAPHHAPAAAAAPAAAPLDDVAPAAAPRRSPRFNNVAASLDVVAGQHHVQMAMSALCSSLPGGEDRLNEADMEVAFAIAGGLALLEQQTPNSWKEAMASSDAPKWRAAADKEMAGCEQMEVWDLVARSSVPRWHTIITCKWVFKIKVDSSGAVEVYKARLTPKGFLQVLGINFSETFAATGKYKSMRAGLMLTAACGHELDQMDVPQAFLNAPVDEEVYMELPEGYRTGREHLVCKLKKSLYGLKQAPRNWYLLISKFLVEQLGYKATVSDPCLFFKRARSGRLMLLFLFVDDFQSSYHPEDKAEWGELKSQLVDRFKTKDLGASTWILGMRISRNRAARTITLDQELYVTKALERYKLENCKAVSTPGVAGSAADRDAADEAAGSGPVDRQLYQEMVGTLMYSAVSCRPDIAYAVQQLARAMQAPTSAHMQAAKRVFRYLAGTKDVGLVFGSRNGDALMDTRGRNCFRLDVCAFADADWANDKSDRKSITGWVAKVNGDPISWASKKQRTVAQSTCEAELYAEAAAIQEVLWLRGLLKELGLHVQTGSLVHGDNQSTLAISKNGIKGERTKHVDVKYHFITETVESGTVQLKWIPTTEQQADIFTKALAAPVFEHFRQLLMTR